MIDFAIGLVTGITLSGIAFALFLVVVRSMP